MAVSFLRLGMPLPPAPLRLSSKSIFRRASTFRQAGPSTACSFQPCLARMSLSRGFPSDCRAIRAARRSIRTAWPVGGVGVEGDLGFTRLSDLTDNDQPAEEIIAVYATTGYATPVRRRVDNILVGGIRLPFVNVTDPGTATVRFPLQFAGSCNGDGACCRRAISFPAILNGVSGQFSSRFPIIAGSGLYSRRGNYITRQCRCHRQYYAEPRYEAAKVAMQGLRCQWSIPTVRFWGYFAGRRSGVRARCRSPKGPVRQFLRAGCGDKTERTRWLLART